MKHKDAIGAMYYVCGYVTCIALIFEGEHLYQKLLAATYGFYLTYHILNQYDN